MKPQITYHTNGEIKSVIYSLNGNCHRTYGPALRTWWCNGNRQRVMYFINDRLHRTDGPAYQFWYANGQLRSEGYWINGEEYTKEELTAMNLINAEEAKTKEAAKKIQTKWEELKVMVYESPTSVLEELIDTGDVIGMDQAINDIIETRKSTKF